MHEMYYYNPVCAIFIPTNKFIKFYVSKNSQNIDTMVVNVISRVVSVHKISRSSFSYF